MYGIKESNVRAMSDELIRDRQILFDEVLPNWENRIFKLAVMTHPKVDRRLLGLDDLQQELRLALWEAVLSFDESKGVAITTWVRKITDQASKLIAKMQFHKMPHNSEGHGAQLLSLRHNVTVVPNENDSESYEIPTSDPDSIERVEAVLAKKECIRIIRPALGQGFEQDVFDLFMEGYTGGDIVNELGLDPKRGAAARVSSVRLKIKIAYAIIYAIPLDTVSSAKNAEYLAGRMRHRLSCKKDEEVPEELPPPNMYPQFV